MFVALPSQRPMGYIKDAYPIPSYNPSRFAASSHRKATESQIKSWQMIEMFSPFKRSENIRLNCVRLWGVPRVNEN